MLLDCTTAQLQGSSAISRVNGFNCVPRLLHIHVQRPNVSLRCSFSLVLCFVVFTLATVLKWFAATRKTVVEGKPRWAKTPDLTGKRFGQLPQRAEQQGLGLCFLFLVRKTFKSFTSSIGDNL